MVVVCRYNNQVSRQSAIMPFPSCTLVVVVFVWTVVGFNPTTWAFHHQRLLLIPSPHAQITTGVTTTAHPTRTTATTRCPCRLSAAAGGSDNNNNKPTKTAADEILDALDTMLGVSPLSETDLKAATNNGEEQASVDLQQRVAQREKEAPPVDALNKQSVLVFFFILGLFPVLSMFAAVQWGGIKPFGL